MGAPSHALAMSVLHTGRPSAISEVPDGWPAAREGLLRTEILDYFDRLAIIHLPEREDRMRALRAELSRIGIDVHSPKVSISKPPMPKYANEFPSRGVYGNLLSYLEILESAYSEGLDTVWLPEDDESWRRGWTRIGIDSDWSDDRDHPISSARAWPGRREALNLPRHNRARVRLGIRSRDRHYATSTFLRCGQWKCVERSGE